MKVISIISSYRKNGNTTRLVKCIEEELLLISKKQNVLVDIETIFLGHMDIQNCHGCRICFDKAEEHCQLKDDVLNIRNKIQEADAIILASPVYVEDINGIMKNWIDRMAFNNHRPAFSGKSAFIVTTSGIGSSNHALKTMNNALNPWGFYVAGKDKFRTGAILEVEEIKNRYNNRLKNIAHKLFYAIINEKASNPSFYSLVVFKVQQKYWQNKKRNKDSIDFLYWKNKGWLKDNCEYYIENRASRIKVICARFAGAIISKFFV